MNIFKLSSELVAIQIILNMRYENKKYFDNEEWREWETLIKERNRIVIQLTKTILKAENKEKTKEIISTLSECKCFYEKTLNNSELELIMQTTTMINSLKQLAIELS